MDPQGLNGSDLGTKYTNQDTLPGRQQPDQQQWLASGTPIARATMLVKGLHFGVPEAPTDQTQSLLDSRCGLISDRKLIYDPGAKWKRRFAPEEGQLDWRIEIREYSCR